MDAHLPRPGWRWEDLELKLLTGKWFIQGQKLRQGGKIFHLTEELVDIVVSPLDVELRKSSKLPKDLADPFPAQIYKIPD